MGGLFTGALYDPKEDDERLSRQIARIYAVMKDGSWKTLKEIEEATGDMTASVSRQLRFLKEARFGGYVVKKRSRGPRSEGLFEYQVLPPDSEAPPAPVVKGKLASGYFKGLRRAAQILIAAEDLRAARAALKNEIEKFVGTK